MKKTIGFGNFKINKHPIFRKNDKVRMINCYEAEVYNKKGKNEWTCREDDFNTPNGRAVFLLNFSGYFLCENLERINKLT